MWQWTPDWQVQIYSLVNEADLEDHLGPVCLMLRDDIIFHWCTAPFQIIALFVM